MYKRLLLIALIVPAFSMAQNVGIGTSTPSSRLHVVDSSNNVLRFLLQAPTLATSESRMELITGNNTFNFFGITKYAVGTTGSMFDVPKDNLSVIHTGGNAGPLMLANGNGASPIIFGAGTGERMRITAEGRVGIGTTTPATANSLHVHSNDFASGGDVSIGITNSFTTDAIGRGARFRMNASDLAIINNEPTGKISLSTNFNQRLVITPAGNIGINNTNPAYLLDIGASGSRGININQTGNSSAGLVINSTPGNTNNIGITVNNPTNFSIPNNFSVGIHSVSGSGAVANLGPNSNYALIGECRNNTEGVGILAVSNSPSPQILQAAMVGTNFSNAASVYGIIGRSSGSSGAGTVGYTENGTTGLLGVADPISTGPAIKSVLMPGALGAGLELENGVIKVSGAKRTAFQHVAVASNISANETIIPSASTYANNATDMLFVTPVWEGVYVNAPIGVYFLNGSWRIFRQDLQPMPLNAKFNVLVIKQ